MGEADGKAKDDADEYEKEALSVGDAAKRALFKGIVICLDEITKEQLQEFKAEGGFDVTSTKALSEKQVAKATGKRSALWSGQVFTLAFDKPKWRQLRRAAKRFIGSEEEEEKKS